MPTDQALNQLRGLGIKHFNADHDAVALEVFHLYLQFRSDDWEVLRYYARCLLFVGCKSEAEKVYIRLVSSKQDQVWPELHAELGQLYYRLGRFELAEQHWELYCRDEATPGWCWVLRGVNLYRCERFDEAVKCHQKALKIYEECDHDEAYFNLGAALRALGRYSEATEAFQHALEVSPDYSDAKEALVSMENWKESIEEAKRLLSSEEG